MKLRDYFLQGPELSAEETPPQDSSISKGETTTEEKELAPVEAEESSSSDSAEEGKEEEEKSCKAESEDSKVDGFAQNSSRGVLENPISPAGSDDSSSFDTSLRDQTLSSGKEDGENSKAELDEGEVDGFNESSSGGVLENSVSASDSDKSKSSSRDTSYMDQVAVPEKEDDSHNRQAEPDQSSSQNSPRGVLENAASSDTTHCDGSSTSDASSVDQTIAPDKVDEQNSKAEPDYSKVDGSDQDSPRGVLENAVSSAYSDGSSSSDTCSVDQTVAPYGTGLESHSLHWRSLISRLITRNKKSMLRLPTFPLAMRSSSLRRASERIKSRKDDQIDIAGIAKDVGIGKPSWRSFDYEELVTATNGFGQENLIGKGGHAEVYKGSLVDGQLVAVKKLAKGDNEETRVADFLSELGIIAHVNHPNAAQLIGFSVERGLHLVLRFSAHGSLASVLHGSKESLEWKVRFKIAVGVAEGLLYLHEGCQRRIIHRDIKASNILLADDYQPQISDFGLAKWLPDNWNHHIVFPIEGTFGYMAPEYFMHGVMNEKTDVFAFGVVLLELVTGRLAIDFSRQSLVIWAKPLLAANKVSELVDPALSDAYNLKEATRALHVASMCIHHLSTSRPSMKEVVRLLRSEDGLIELMEQASRSKVSRSPLSDAPGMEEYTCSRYLNDLHRHKQLALEQ